MGYLLAAAEERAVPLLVQMGIEKDAQKIVTQIYEAAVNTDELKMGVGFFLAQTDRRARAEAAKLGKSPNSIGTLAGTWMEYSLLVALKQRGKAPLYWQAEFPQFRNNYFDVVLFTREHGPVVLSPKTSLRERYKQADLEAFGLKRFFPEAKFYLLTLDADKRHVANLRQKIADRETQGLDGLFDETDVEELFRRLDPLTVVAAPDGALRSGREIR